MNIYMNKFTYNYDADGNISDAQVGLYGNNSDGGMRSAMWDP